jgi:hypothetical protein
LPPVEEQEADWRLDEQTRLVGRRGVAEARAVLDTCRNAPAGLGQRTSRAA